MRVIIDGQALRLYPFGGEGFTGATEVYARKIASGLASLGHQVHVVAPDLEDDEQRGPNEWWWPAKNHPTKADAVVCVHSLEFASQYSGDALILATNGIDPPYLGEMAEMVAAFPVFSRNHGELLCKHNPHVDPKRCVVTGLGVHLDEYTPLKSGWTGDNLKEPGRIWVGNDPARGLWHVLDILEAVQKHEPTASLVVTYDFDRQFERHRWQQNILAETLRECRFRLKTIPNVVNAGALDRAKLVREQLAAQFHVWPSDPQNVGTQIHGVSQMEAAAAGCSLVLSDTEAFPEVFGEAAAILPVPGRFIPEYERRVDAQDYADVIVEQMRDPAKWAEASRKARALAEQHTWAAVITKWGSLMQALAESGVASSAA